MKQRLTLIAGFLITTLNLFSGIVLVRLNCEYLVNPSVIDVVSPGLSWINKADAVERGQLQTAWEIRVAESKESLLSEKKPGMVARQSNFL